MSCTLTSGKTRGCRTGFGGIKTVDITEWENLSSVTIVNKVVTAMTLVSGKRTWRYELEEEVGNFTDKFAGSRTAGTGVWTQTVSMPLVNFDSTTITEIEKVVQNRIIAVVGYSDGTYKLAGLEVGLMVDTADHDSGTVHEDKNGLDMMLSSKQTVAAPFVSAGIVAQLLVAS